MGKTFLTVGITVLVIVVIMYIWGLTLINKGLTEVVEEKLNA